MTTVADDNVHCIELEGSFDDCQNIMKTVFADADYKAKYQLGAVNSVNWARVLAQIVYYGYASLRHPNHRYSVCLQETSVTFLRPISQSAWVSR
jgi:threonine synthase